MACGKLHIETQGEGLYSITDNVLYSLKEIIEKKEETSGVLHVFCMHTSCALAISESYDPTAKTDLQEFLKRLAPRDLPFIKHTSEGPDDSPSHMKSILLHPSLTLLVESGKLILGGWQGIYLAEFRDAPRKRHVLLKFIAG